MIKFSHVYKTFPGPIHALNNINLQIEKGEFVFLTGPSGAGKTTLFKMLSAYDKITSGALNVAGFDLSRISLSHLYEYRSKVGVVFQDFKLLKDHTLIENVMLPLIIKGEKPHLIQRRTWDILEQVGLTDKAHQYPEFTSGGEQQRAAIARALIHKPGLLIADEPTGNLDPELSEEILILFDKACAQGTTVFIATHNQDIVHKRRRRTLKISNGELHEEFL